MYNSHIAFAASQQSQKQSLAGTALRPSNLGQLSKTNDQKKIMQDITMFLLSKHLDKVSVDLFLRTPTNKAYCEILNSLCKAYFIDIDFEKGGPEEASNRLAKITDYRVALKKDWFNPIGVLSSWGNVLQFLRHICQYVEAMDEISNLMDLFSLDNLNDITQKLQNKLTEGDIREEDFLDFASYYVIKLQQNGNIEEASSLKELAKKM